MLTVTFILSETRSNYGSNVIAIEGFWKLSQYSQYPIRTTVNHLKEVSVNWAHAYFTRYIVFSIFLMTFCYATFDLIS